MSARLKETCNDIFRAMVYSDCPGSYENSYQTLLRTAPQNIIHYFNEHWHPIKEEWTQYSMRQGNLNNFTNNRLETLNAKIKQLVPKRSRLVPFFEKFFTWVEDHNREIDAKVAREFLTQPVFMEPVSEAELKYSSLLTKFAFEEIKKKINFLKHIANIININEELRQATVVDSTEAVDASVSKCNCRFFESMGLPCAHIFAVRNYFGEDLFHPALCAERWKKENLTKTRLFASSTPLTDISAVRVFSSNINRAEPDVPQKRKNILEECEALAFYGSTFCGEKFKNKIETLRNIASIWASGQDAILLNVLPINVEKEAAFPPASKVVGKPKGFNKTFVQIKNIHKSAHVS